MTERDRQVLDMISQNLTVGEIASRLGISRSAAGAIVLRAIDEHGDPRFAKIDEHIAALRRIKVAG
jgi:FixJ family two-component response regulator